eukprot:1147823-Pelagomonas_calceolata.AAC.7
MSIPMHLGSGGAAYPIPESQTVLACGSLKASTNKHASQERLLERTFGGKFRDPFSDEVMLRDLSAEHTVLCCTQHRSVSIAGNPAQHLSHPKEIGPLDPDQSHESDTGSLGQLTWGSSAASISSNR